MDWQTPAKLLERKDGGSDMYYEFSERRVGALAELVAATIALPASEAARLVIDAGAQGTFSIAEIRALAARGDYPG